MRPNTNILILYNTTGAGINVFGGITEDAETGDVTDLEAIMAWCVLLHLPQY